MSKPSKATAEAANWTIAHSWATGLDLTYAGVALADCALYPVLAALGRISLAELETPKDVERADGQPNG